MEIGNRFSFKRLVLEKGREHLFDSSLSCFIFINILAFNPFFRACRLPLKRNQPEPPRKQNH